MRVCIAIDVFLPPDHRQHYECVSVWPFPASIVREDSSPVHGLLWKPYSLATVMVSTSLQYKLLKRPS